MFVVADMEWTADGNGRRSPTQLAAARVNENWSIITSFSSFVKPRSSMNYNWKNTAFTGGSASCFYNAPSLHRVLKDFSEWLNSDDILLWWDHNSLSLFRLLHGIILKEEDNHRSVCINRYVYAYLRGQANSAGDVPAIADARGIDTLAYRIHHSPDDVKLICELMALIAYPQDYLLEPAPPDKRDPAPKAQYPNAPYQYDPDSEMIHQRDCPGVTWHSTVGFETLRAPIRKGLRPCKCCAEEYRKAVRARNLEFVEHNRFVYLYTPGSKVFHRSACSIILSAKDPIGTSDYAEAAAGRRPCKICRPTPYDSSTPLSEKHQKKLSARKARNSLPRNTANAVIRQHAAACERNKRLQNDSLSADQREDVYTLTQPRFAFWASAGYSTFHLRSCPKLHNLSSLRGFSRYSDAVRAGYMPCKKCKPTAKNDITLSIPITSRVRKGETPNVLIPLCQSAGYTYVAEACRFLIETSVGKWIIRTDVLPIQLAHINLVLDPDAADYHEQPRLFLSYSDAFYYIHRHDSALARTKRGG